MPNLYALCRAVELVGMEMSTDLPSALEGESCIKVSGTQSGDTSWLSQAAGFDMTKHAVDRLYIKSGLGPGEVQVVELHDCFSANGIKCTQNVFKYCFRAGDV